MVELVDTPDSKSGEGETSWGFDPPSSYHQGQIMRLSKVLPGYKGVQSYMKDFLHDFVLTVREVCGENTLAQLLGAAFVTAVFALGILLIWGLLSFALGGIVYYLWNWVAWLPSMGYWESYCLTLLSFILFRGPVIHLSD